MLAASLTFAVSGAPMPALAGPELPVRGIVRPVNMASVSTDLPFRIVSLPFRKGESFKKGDLLVRLDCARLMAERKSLQAERKIQQLAFQNNSELNKLNAIGEFDVLTAKAKVEKADAEISRLDVRIARCDIKAPYDGRVDALVKHENETPKAGEPVIRIIQDDVLEVEFIVPSNWLGWLAKGTAFSFKIDETGRTYKGELVRLGASVDPVSQTIEVTGRFTGKAKGVLAGMSGSAKFAKPEG